MPIIMLSAVTDNGTHDTIKALQYGAFDFVRKPDSTLHLDIGEVSKYLTDKLHAAAESIKMGALRMLPAVEERSAEPVPAEGNGALDPPETEEHHETATNAPPAPPEVPDASAVGTVTAVKSTPASKKTSRAAATRWPSGVAGRTLPKAGPAPPARLAPTGPKVADKWVARSPGSRLGASPSAVPKVPPQVRRTPVSPETAAAVAMPARRTAHKPSTKFDQIVVIGTSTGGPRALHEVLTKLPADFEAPVLVVQHMPPKFTYSLAQRLDSFSAIRVCEAKQDDRLETATAYIAPGGKQMTVVQDSNGAYRIRLTTEGPRSGHMPSVDVLFESLVGLKELKRHAVLMTGMGSDGARGMKALKEDGAATLIAESEETCVVYGMPRSAVELGAVTSVLPLHQIGPRLCVK